MLKFILKGYWSTIRGRITKYRNASRAIGTNTFLDSSVQVLGWSHLKIGSYCVIGEHSVFTINNRTGGEDKKIIIDDNSYVGRNNFFTSGKLIRLKAYTITANDCAFIGSNHAFEDPFIPYSLSGNTDGGEIEVGVNCWLGHGVKIVGNVKIGHGCIIGAGALINKDIPPFSVVVGNPQKIIKRYNFENKLWERNDETKVYDMPGEEQYLELLRSKYPISALAFHAASKAFGDL